MNKENFEQEKIGELNNFIDKNLRTILQQTETWEAKDLQANLLALSNKINREIDTPQAHKLSFDIMGIALGLLSAKKNNYLQDEIPSEVFSIILDNLNPNNLASDIKFLKSTERTSKMWMKEINAHILRRINEENLSLSIVGCKTGSEAINYIIKNKLQSANLSEFSDITDEDLNKLIENCPDLHTLFLQSDKIKEVPFEKLQALQSLDLTGCMQLSGDKLAEALGKLTALQSLNLQGARSFREINWRRRSASLQPFKAWILQGARSFRGINWRRRSASLQPFKAWILQGARSFREINWQRRSASLQPFKAWILQGARSFREINWQRRSASLQPLKAWILEVHAAFGR